MGNPLSPPASPTPSSSSFLAGTQSLAFSPFASRHQIFLVLEDSAAATPPSKQPSLETPAFLSSHPGESLKHRQQQTHHCELVKTNFFFRCKLFGGPQGTRSKGAYPKTRAQAPCAPGFGRASAGMVFSGRRGGESSEPKVPP